MRSLNLRRPSILFRKTFTLVLQDEPLFLQGYALKNELMNCSKLVQNIRRLVSKETVVLRQWEVETKK